MKTVPIGDVVEKTRQCDPRELGRDRFTYIDISSVDRELKRIVSAQSLSTSQAPSRARKEVRAGDVILSTVRPNLNAVALVQQQFDGEIASTGFAVLRAKPTTLDPRYLFYFLQTQPLVSHLTRIATGASYPAISDADALQTLVPLPRLAEQERIAAILERADRLRRLRRYGLAMAKSFLPAVFDQLFGDERVKAGVPFVTSKNIRPFELDLSDLEYVTAEVHREIIKRCNPRFGDVLYTNIGVNVGNAVVNNLRFEFSLKNVALIQPDSTKLNSRFLESLLNHSRFKEAILNVSSVGGAQKFVSLDVLRRIQIVVPPMLLQQRFAMIVEQHERLQTVRRESLRQAEHLFQTLLYRAYTNDL